jgi:hypothetical protein
LSRRAASLGARRRLSSLAGTRYRRRGRIVEVLSPSTEAYDRGAKFSHYKRLGTCTEYLLVATDRIHVDRFVHESDGT